MKILYVNWVPTRALESTGGGVSLYQKNLLEYFSNSDDEVYYLTAGYKFNLFKKKTYIRQLQSKIRNINEFEIVNSKILAPSYYSFNDGSLLFHSDESVNIIKQFLIKHGPFDVIHFNNLEGFPLTWLELKIFFPETKFIYSLHNYFAFCPQVNLWYRDSENCTDFCQGERCKDCNIFPINKTIIKINSTFENNKFISKLVNKLKRRFKYLLNKIHKQPPLKVDEETNNVFLVRRSSIVDLCNENIDVFLSVSKRVKEIAIHYGLNQEKNRVLYIGTKHSKNRTRKPLNVDNNLTICYMGYMRADKGFYFFLSCLNEMPCVISKKLKVIIAAPNTDPMAMNLLKSIKNKFLDFHFCDGYNQTQIPSILREVELGIIPVQWEDNLPQIAYEFVCNGVPILTSDLGGAHELSNNKSFVFKSNSKLDFINKIKYFIEDKNRLEAYWDSLQEQCFKTIEAHGEELKELYKT